MKTILSHRFLESFILVLVLDFFFTAVCAGQAYFQPQSEIYIESVYTDTEMVKQIGNSVRWKVVPGMTQEGYTLAFFHEDSRIFCSLRFEPARTDGIFELLDSQETVIDRMTGAFIPDAGFPVPCRIIDYDDLKAEKDLLKTGKMAGGRSFSRGYHIRTESISWSDAVKFRWIDPVQFPEATTLALRLFIAESTDQKIAFRQLWQENDPVSWWLYEETPAFESWRK